MRAASWNEDERTIDVTWSTGARVLRFSWEAHQYVDEELDMSSNAVRLARLNAGAPVLDSHRAGSLGSQIGLVVPGSARLVGGRGLAKLRLSDRPELAGIIADIRAGIIRNLSIGYTVHRYEVDEKRGERPLWRAVDWEPFEVSFTPVPADPDAQTRGQAEFLPCIFERKQSVMPDPVVAPVEEPLAVPSGAVQVSAAEIARRCQQGGFGIEVATRLIDMNDAQPMTRANLDAELGRHWSGLGAAPVIRSSFAPAMVVTDERDTRRAAVAGYLRHRLTGQAEGEGPARQYLGLSLCEMLRAEALADGVREARHWSKLQLVERAMHVSSDFPNLLQSSGNRFLLEVYKGAESPIKRAMRIREVPDFREISSIQLDGPSYLAETPESGEVQHGTFVEASEKNRVKTFARAFKISRQALINDDLGAFAQATQMMAAAAANTEAAQISSLLLLGSGDGPQLSDGVRLFSTAASRANKAASGSILSVANLGLASAAMRKQLHLDGVTPTNAKPRYVLVGADREVEARQVVNTTMVPNATSSVNPFAGELEPIVDARMTGNSWRLFADPALFPVLELAYLEGRTAPEIESFDTVTTLGITFRVVFDFSPAVVNWRGAYLNPGA